MAFTINTAIMPALALAATVSLGGAAWSANAPDNGLHDAQVVKTGAEIAYADAPYGVDPVVTGPVSKKFKIQRQMSGCEIALWPDVPLTCYPD